MPAQPNILIIHADQHRWDCLGAYGNPDVRTPHIDGLAQDGVLYQNNFCPFPVCTPSRYSFLSGLFVHQHLGWTNRCTPPAGLPTFPRLLKSDGYHTTAVGKMHFTPTYLDLGFEQMHLAEQDGAGRYADDYHRWLRAQGLIDHLDLMDQVKEYRQTAPAEYWDSYGAMTSDLDEAHHSTTWIGDRALETLQDWDRGGNLLMAGFIKPHHPFDPPPPWDKMYDPQQLTPLPGWTHANLPHDLAHSQGYFPYETLNETQLRRVMAHYYAAISQIDFQVGRMIDILKQKNLYDQTLILYTSDHGEYLGFHHMLLKGNYLYDPLVRIPLIIKYPHRQNSVGERAGQVSPALVSTIDIAPTLLRAAGIEPPAAMSGADLADPGAGDEFIFAEVDGGKEYMVRSLTSKLLLCRDAEQSQFFDLRSDPLEMKNRWEDPACQSEITRLRHCLLNWALFDSPTPNHVDAAAASITASNLPGEAEVAASREYFHQRFFNDF